MKKILLIFLLTGCIATEQPGVEENFADTDETKCFNAVLYFGLAVGAQGNTTLLTNLDNTYENHFFLVDQAFTQRDDLPSGTAFGTTINADSPFTVVKAFSIEVDRDSKKLLEDDKFVELIRNTGKFVLTRELYDAQVKDCP